MRDLTLRPKSELRVKAMDIAVVIWVRSACYFRVVIPYENFFLKIQGALSF